MTSASTYSDPVAARSQATQQEELSTRELQRRAAIANLPQRSPPVFENACLRHGGASSPANVTVILGQKAAIQIAEHANSNLNCEMGGVLLGGAYRRADELYVEVRAALPAVTRDSGPVHFTFTADAWSQLHRDRAVRYPALDIVGWFHTHPDLGVFYSSDDVVVHSAAFTMPWHVGLVVDPVRAEAAFFGWQGLELRPIEGFYESKELQESSVVPWKSVPTAIWDYDYEAESLPERNEVLLATSSRPSLPAVSPYLGLVAGALGLLLSFLMLFAWIMPLTREVDRLQNTVIVLADRALADGNAATCPDPRLRILTPAGGQSLRLGEEVEIIGTAMFPDASRYQVNVRPAGSDSWTLLNTVSRDEKLDTLATWDTTSAPPSIYELRLTAVDRNNIRLNNSPSCSVAIELQP